MRQRNGAFTLIEIAIAVSIMLLLLLLAVPSMSGVLADRRLHRSLDSFNKLVREAQERSLAERRAYLIVWQKDRVLLRPEVLQKKDSATPAAVIKLARGEAFTLSLPAAMTEHPAAEWIFWPTGTCEPAVVRFKGASGSWTANYSALTGQAEVANYAAR